MGFVGSNITVNSGTISLTKANVTSALGYTPPTSNTTYSIATTSTPGLVKPVSVITKPTFSLPTEIESFKAETVTIFSLSLKLSFGCFFVFKIYFYI